MVKTEENKVKREWLYFKDSRMREETFLFNDA